MNIPYYTCQVIAKTQYLQSNLTYLEGMNHFKRDIFKFKNYMIRR